MGLNGLMKIKVKRNSYDEVLDAVLVYTSLDLIKTSPVDFVCIVSKRKPRILHSYGEQTLLNITEKHQALSRVTTSEPSLLLLSEIK